MTPFDTVALVAMLVTFYPVVSAPEFARARRERPEYFGGGVIFGSKGDKLRLPDGREWDCIQAAGGPPSGRRWICIPIDPNDQGATDPFALEAGPLDPLDEQLVIFPGGDPSLVDLVAGALGGLDGAEGLLDGAAAAVVQAADPNQLDGTYRARVEPARDAHGRIRAALDSDDPGELLARTSAQDGEIDAARQDYVEESPPDTGEPDPGDPPGDDDRHEPPEK